MRIEHLLRITYVLIGLQEVQSTGQACPGITFPFVCADTSCIKRRDYCSGVAECLDGSDELLYNSSVHSSTGGIECSHRRQENHTCFLPEEYICDHDVDCVGGVDECGCESTFSCDNGECQLRVQFCDGSEDCADGSDEKAYSRKTGGFQCQVKKKHTTLSCVLPDIHVCDGSSECQWGTDECFCDFSNDLKNGTLTTKTYSNDKCFRCLDGTLVIPNNHVCDGIIHCKDLSDECLCRNEERTSNNTRNMCENVCVEKSCECPGQLRCQKRQHGSNMTTEAVICIKPDQICDDNYDCENGFDEDFCALSGEFFTCANNRMKVRKSTICDGIEDCADGSDEIRCYEDKYICNTYKDTRLFPFLEGRNESDPYPPLNRTIIEQRFGGFFYYWPYYADACDGIPLCPDSDDECNNTQCTGPKPGFCNFDLQCPNSQSRITGYEVCDGQPTCNDTAPHTSVDEWGCPERFYCENYGLTRLPIHIPEEHRCDGKAECDDQSDELDCSNKTHFYCEDQGSTLFIPMSKRCDKRKDCTDGRDECDNCETSPFSSDQKLIKSRILIVFLWIIALVATLGNSINIVYQCILIYKLRNNTASAAVKNRFLVLNLAIADLLTGVYVLSLGIKDSLVDKYCLLDQEWRSSSTCQILGAMAVVGTEASVMILLIMTSYRLHLVFYPFRKQSMRLVIAAVLVAWTIAIILAVAPLSFSAREYFLSCVWFRNHRYLGYTCKSEITDFTKKLVIFDGPDKLFNSAVGGMSEYTWDSMLAAQKVLNESYFPERYFGYYSAHSVCLPRLFPDRLQDRSWGYSMFLIVFNFFALVYILCGYIAIYKRSTSNQISANKEDRAAKLQRKVTRIVLTDFLCWMPICIMAFLKVGGVDVGDTAYAVTAVILLPINSAINPFLYSSLLDVIWKYLQPARKPMTGSQIETQLSSIRIPRSENRGFSVAAITAIPTYHIDNEEDSPPPAHILANKELNIKENVITAGTNL